MKTRTPKVLYPGVLVFMFVLILEQPDNLACLEIYIHIVEDGARRQARHGAHSAKQRIDEARASACAYFADGDAEAIWSIFLCCICAEGEMGFRHTQRQVAKTKTCEARDLLFSFGSVIHTVGAIDLACDGFNLFFDGYIQRIKLFKFAGFFTGFDNIA